MKHKKRGAEGRSPHKRLRRVYRLLAAGRYAALWLPEFIAAYDIILCTEGEAAAKDWALRELSCSVAPSVSIRLYRLFRFVYLAWEVYRRIVKD